ncbi:hypothetical protein FQS87_08210 [Enterococcus avium]|uniref:hypothetical protein n=1 Tax=Enterococcus TaxID=1350 RepID=UPI001A9783A3|nr:hypothetical protein [Enterococcus avium]MBO1139878.1 hypothetical protein [Enterococcus avium]
MRLTKNDSKLLAHPSGQCKLNTEAQYILYMKDNWEEVQAFCEPFKIERSKLNLGKGRAVIDLPSGNETFDYGMVLVRLGNKRILIFSSNEFVELFSVSEMD